MLKVLGVVCTNQQWLSEHYCLGPGERLDELCVYHEQGSPSWWQVGEVLKLVLVRTGEEISMGRRGGEKKIRKSRWKQLQNSLRKWNSKKPRVIVQHCGFLSKYDSPCAGREKIGGLERTRVQFLVRNDVPLKVILRNTLSGEGEGIQMRRSPKGG